MNVCFVLPGFSRRAQGGYKMVFEYSNRLCARGHNVSILFLNEGALKKVHLPTCIKAIIANYLTDKGPSWFSLNKNIRTISSLKRNYKKSLANIDAVAATAIETVECIPVIFPKAKKVYYIQDLEIWNCSEREVYASYGKGFRNIVISEWLKNIVDAHSNKPAVLIKNPVDTEIYKCIVPIEKRRKHSIALLYHENPHKGFEYAFTALKILKKKYADLSVEIFGIYPRPDYFPSYINYTRSATQAQTVEIYNKTAVFLCATVDEGYGLTGLEAMACGTALVSTDYQGVHEYAVNEANALLSPVKDVDALVANVVRLFEDDELRCKIAKEGIEWARKDFNWDTAVEKFEKAITEK